MFAQARKGTDCAYAHPSDVVSSRSSDGGISWGDMTVAVPHDIFGDEGDGIWSPSPVYDRTTDELLLVFDRMLAKYSSGGAQVAIGRKGIKCRPPSVRAQSHL